MNIVRGRILAQRFFDIAEAVNLPHAEMLVRELSRRPRFVGSARHIELPNPPLEMVLGPRGMSVAGLPLSDIMVRLYDVGALVVTFIIDLPSPTAAETLVQHAARIADAEESITHAARPVADEIRTAILAACKISDLTSDIVEDYTIFTIQQTDPVITQGATLSQHLDIPRLLVADPGPIAEQERQTLVHAAFSYRPDDLVVVDWNSAIVLEPQSAQEVCELLELTVMQMLELRTYDSIVGRALDRLYKELDIKQKSLWGGKNYQELSRWTMALFVDMVEITERIDNALTFLGDTWLARLHTAAAAEFGIPRWQKQLRGKLEVLGQVNKLLVDQITSQKSLRLEVAIVGLIVIETLLALFRIGS